MEQFIVNFTDIGIEDANTAGVKNASVGELYKSFEQKEAALLGFAITTAAFRYFISYNSLDAKLKEHTARPYCNDYTVLSNTALQARKLIINSKFPKDLEEAILSAYKNTFPVKDQDVAVRSSPVDATQTTESFLNISGIIPLLYAVKCCYASLYSENALQHGIDGSTLPEMAVGIQQMVRADMACSGIAFTDADNITIKGSWGLGQNFEANHITPDAFTIPKSTLATGAPAISKSLGSKSRMLIYNELAAGTNTTTGKSTPGELREQFILSDEELENLSRRVLETEQRYKTNIVVEWAKDGVSDKIYIVQVQPYIPTKLSASV